MQKRKNAARFLRRLCTAFPLKSRMQYPFPVITKRFSSFCSKLFFSKIKNECKHRPPHRLRRRAVPLTRSRGLACQGTPNGYAVRFPLGSSSGTVLRTAHPKTGASADGRRSRFGALPAIHICTLFPIIQAHQMHANALLVFTLFRMPFFGGMGGHGCRSIVLIL